MLGHIGGIGGQLSQHDASAFAKAAAYAQAQGMYAGLEVTRTPMTVSARELAGRLIALNEKLANLRGQLFGHGPESPMGSNCIDEPPYNVDEALARALRDAIRLESALDEIAGRI